LPSSSERPIHLAEIGNTPYFIGTEDVDESYQRDQPE
jgi:hypothetical protein